MLMGYRFGIPCTLDEAIVLVVTSTPDRPSADHTMYDSLSQTFPNQYQLFLFLADTQTMILRLAEECDMDSLTELVHASCRLSTPICRWGGESMLQFREGAHMPEVARGHPPCRYFVARACNLGLLLRKETLHGRKFPLPECVCKIFELCSRKLSSTPNQLLSL